MVWHGFQTIIYVRKIWNNLTSYYDRRLPSSRWESWWRSWLWPGTERQSQRTTDDMTSSFRTRIWCLRPFFPIWLLRSFLSDSSKNSWLWFDRSSKLFRLLLEVLCIAVNWGAGQLGKLRLIFFWGVFSLSSLRLSLKLLRSGNKSAKQARLQNLEMDTLQHFGPLFCSCLL